MSINKSDLVYDAGSVAADGSRVSGCQFTTPAKAAAGDYTLTLEEGLDATECAILVTPRAAFADNVAPTVQHTSDTVKNILTGTGAGVAADMAFDFVILNLVGV